MHWNYLHVVWPTIYEVGSKSSHACMLFEIPVEEGWDVTWHVLSKCIYPWSLTTQHVIRSRYYFRIDESVSRRLLFLGRANSTRMSLGVIEVSLLDSIE